MRATESAPRWRTAADGRGYKQTHDGRAGSAACRDCHGEGIDSDTSTACRSCGGTGFEGER